MRRALLLAAAAGAAVLALALLPAPWFWIALIASLVLLRAMRWTQRPGLRAACFNLYLLALGLAAIEGYLLVRDLSRLRDEPRYYEGYYRSDSLLGYAPRPGMRTPAIRRHDGAVVYDVVYSIGPDGLRVAPPGPTGDGAPCALFFGGSFTFGEGVGDAETLPYRFGIESGGRLAVRNYGFHGYGPHQMLAALEGGLVEATAHCAPRLAVYQGMVPHVARAAGRSAWDRSGPRYEVDGHGAAVRAGHFDDRVGVTGYLWAALGKSGIVRRLRAARLGAGDVERYLAIVATSRDRFEARYPGATFHVLFWDQPGDATSDRIVRGLRAAGIRTHLVTHILPEIESIEFGAHGLVVHARPGRIAPSGYTLGPSDGHPSAAVYAALARYLAETLATPH